MFIVQILFSLFIRLIDHERIEFLLINESIYFIFFILHHSLNLTVGKLYTHFGNIDYNNTLMIYL
jgi:hypothetical protein